jgi:hypothetical protein
MLERFGVLALLVGRFTSRVRLACSGIDRLRQSRAAHCACDREAEHDTAFQNGSLNAS